MPEALDMTELKEALDQDLNSYFELYADRAARQRKLNALLSEAGVFMAEARKYQGGNTIGPSQYPKFMFPKVALDVEDNTMSLSECTYTDEELEEITGSENVAKHRRDPLLWFGVLVPQSLRQSQKCYKRCLELALEIAGLDLRLAELRESMEKQNGIIIRKTDTNKEIGAEAGP
eukprot:Clim_evm65s144 gene=Clim_evmTU65s144